MHLLNKRGPKMQQTAGYPHPIFQFSLDAHNSLKREDILFGSVASLHYLEDPCWDPAVADPSPSPTGIGTGVGGAGA